MTDDSAGYSEVEGKRCVWTLGRSESNFLDGWMDA